MRRDACIAGGHGAIVYNVRSWTRLASSRDIGLRRRWRTWRREGQRQLGNGSRHVRTRSLRGDKGLTEADRRLVAFQKPSYVLLHVFGRELRCGTGLAVMKMVTPEGLHYAHRACAPSRPHYNVPGPASFSPYRNRPFSPLLE